MTDKPLKLTEGPYGFAWGPVEVERTASIDGQACLTIRTDAGKSISVYVSPTGRSLRVFRDNAHELKEQK